MEGSAAEDIEMAVDRALSGIELEPDEAAAILGYANEALSPLLTPEQTYFVLGSYREPYVRRLRTVQDELNNRIGAYAFVLGDLPPLEVDRVPTFELKFHVVASLTDLIVGVYEQDAGGEMTELGKIAGPAYFQKSHVLPRDYYWDGDLTSRPEVVAAVVNAVHEDSGDESSIVEESDLDVASTAVLETAAERLDAEADLPSYSWVHSNEFRKFDIEGRCHPWVLVTELRDAVDAVP